MGRPYILADTHSLLLFLSIAIAAHLVLAFAVALPLSLVAWGVDRLLITDKPRAGLWRGLLFAALVVGFGFPGLFLFTDELLKPVIRGYTGAIASYGTLILWLLVAAVLRDSRRAYRFQWACLGGALVLIGLTAIATVGALGLRSRPALLPGSNGETPNILLVSIDSLRADHLSCYGYSRQTSPVIDTLAVEGGRFATVVAPTSWTLPSHLTMLTGMPPSGHGVTNGGLQLPDEIKTLPQVLWDRGYATAGFVSGPYLHAEYGFARGFDSYDDYTVAALNDDQSSHGITSPGLLSLVSDWLSGWDNAGRQRPFFLFLHMWDVHYDYSPPPPYDTRFDPDYQGMVTGEDYEHNPQVFSGMAPRDLQHIEALYDGEIAFTDSYLGRILDRLRTLAVLDNTIVVVTADHGEEFFEHGNKSHHKALYDESILVPLLFRYPPRVVPGQTINGQVGVMDIAPTILSLAGIGPLKDFARAQRDPAFAARDLAPLLEGLGDDNDFPPAFSELHHDQASIRTATSKLIRIRGRSEAYELYDLSADPGEKHNLLLERPELAGRLDKQLVQWTRSWGGHLKAREFELSEDQKKKLRSLGYIQ